MASSTAARKRFRRLSPPSPSILCDPPGRELVPPLPMTPPDPEGGDPLLLPEPAISAIETATHVFSTECSALANLQRIYETDKLARVSMERAVTQISGTIRGGGKLILCGVGKSGLIAKKIVATMNSMAIQSCFLHPTEALHGDLGMVRQNDTLLFISFSGKTSELLQILPHLPFSVAIIAITAHRDPSTCPLLASANRGNTILLPAPIHESELVSFKLPAPTSSTTVALAVGDALALATARRLHTTPERSPADVFRIFHPGGAIGVAYASASATPPSGISSARLNPSYASRKRRDSSIPGLDLSAEKTIDDLATPMSVIPMASFPSSTASPRIRDVLRSAISCPVARCWVRISETEIISPRRLRTLAERPDVDCQIGDLPDKSSIAVHKESWLSFSKSTTLETVRQTLRPEIDGPSQNMTENGDSFTRNSRKRDADGNEKPPEGRIIAVVDEKNEVLGILEEEDVWLEDQKT